MGNKSQYLCYTLKRENVVLTSNVQLESTYSHQWNTAVGAMNG